MRILLVNKFYYLRGGSERYFFDLEKILKENGHEVVPFSMRDEKNEKTEYEKFFVSPVDVDKFSLKNIVKIFYNYETVKKLKALLKEEKIDMAHLNNIDYQIGPAIIKILKKRNIPVIQTLHDYGLICPNRKLFSKNEVCYRCEKGGYYHCVLRECIKDSWAKSLLGALEFYFNKKLYKDVDLFIAPSAFMEKICVAFGIPENKIVELYNFIPSNFQKEDNAEVGDYYLYFGRLADEKGIFVLLKAMAGVKEKLKIAGTGSEQKKIEKEIAENGLEGQIEILGYKSGEELKKIIIGAKAVVVPSLWPENMPLSVLEAMTLGKVVIASKIGGIPEVIKNGETGILFAPGDSSELNSILKSLGKEKMETIGENAKKFSRNLNGTDYFENLLRIYKRFVGKRKRIEVRGKTEKRELSLKRS